MTDPVLIGVRCVDCGVVAYPSVAACPRCAGETMTEQPLSRHGTLWTWTVQRFPPKSPPYAGAGRSGFCGGQARQSGTAGTFAPFAVGYVELAEGVRVEAILDVDDVDTLAIGQPLRLSAAHGVPHFALAQA